MPAFRVALVRMKADLDQSPVLTEDSATVALRNCIAAIDGMAACVSIYDRAHFHPQLLSSRDRDAEFLADYVRDQPVEIAQFADFHLLAVRVDGLDQPDFAAVGLEPDFARELIIKLHQYGDDSRAWQALSFMTVRALLRLGKIDEQEPLVRLSLDYVPSLTDRGRKLAAAWAKQ